MDINRKKRLTAGLSVASNSLLVIGKLTIGILINSVSVISEAIHSAIDLVASVIALFAVRESGKPPDRLHPFGHGKAEGLSGAFEGLLILVAVIIIVIEAIRKLVHGAEVDNVDLGLVIMGVSALANGVVSWRLFKVARESESLALEADALHLSTDVLTSVGVFLGLVLIKVTDMHMLDPLVAFGVAALIAHAAYDIVRRSIKDLMDERLSEDELAVVKNVLATHRDYFIGFHELRSRKSGSQREIDLHLVQCREMNLQDAHRVCDHLEEELRQKLPRAHLVIHVEPCEDDCKRQRDYCRIDPTKLDSHISPDEE